MKFEQLTEMVKEVCLKQGEHVPQIFVQGSKNTVMAILADLPEDFKKRHKGFFVAGAKIALEADIGLLQSVYFASEGWMSRVKKDEKMSTRPKDDPKRVECLILAGTDMENSKDNFICFEMLRNKDKKLTGLKPLDKKGETSYKSPLIEAFIAGFFAAKARIQNISDTDKFDVAKRRVVN